VKIKRLTEDTLVARALRKLAWAVFYHRGWFVYPQLVLFVLCVFYTVKFLEFDTGRDNLVGANQKYHRNYRDYKKEFPGQDDLVVVVESEDADKNRQFVERLGARLETETNLFHDVFYKGDLKMMGSKALLFVPEDDLRELAKTLTEYRPFLQRFTLTTNLVSLFGMINTGFRTAKAEQNPENESMVKSLPALERIVDEAAASLRRPGTPLSPGIAALFSSGGTNGTETATQENPGEEAEQQSYVTFAHGRIYLVTAQAPSEDLNGDAVERLRTLVNETQIEVPGLNVGLTGEPVLEHDEMQQSQKDTTVASVASLLVCALIFIYGYQETGRPVKATFCLIIGLGYTMAFATFAVGHLNILTITFVPILIGLAIDYGVHLISRYEEELRRGRSEHDALVKAIVYTGQGIFTGAFTTAGGFLAMAFTDFKGIQEMGIICGGGLLVCLVPMMTMLPVLLLRGRQNVLDHDRAHVAERRARIENLWLQRPIFVTFVTVGLCAMAATQIPKVYFDYDLLHMQSFGLPSVQFEQKLLNSADKSVLFGAIIATNEVQAADLIKKLTNLPVVADVESITKYIGGDQSEKLRMVRDIKAQVAPISFSQPDPKRVDLPELSRTLYSLYGYLGAAHDEAQKDDPALARQLMSLRQAVGDLRKEMLSGTPAELENHAQKLGAFQRALFNDIRDTFEALKHQDSDSPLRAQDLPQALHDRFVGVTGKYLLMVYPKKDVWKRENQKEFIDQVATVYPKMTNTPVQLYYYTELLKESYEEAARYSLIAIAILVLFHFRSALCLALALVPVGVGFLWLGGIMGRFDVPLNPANIMTLPLVIGIGVTNGIHILNRYAEEQTPSILARSTGKAVLVSGLTAIAGFGSLILAKHQGIKSLGYVMSCGLATCMIAGLTFLPALLNLLTRRPRFLKRPGANIETSTPGHEEPRPETSTVHKA
jgi:hopanoid biosynthesis associated RND transporter like protein HpnN